MSTDQDSGYRICVYGEFESCTVVIAKYTGDGTSLGPEDIEVPEKVKALTIRDEYGISHAYNIDNTN